MKIVLVTEYFPRSAECEVRGGIESRAFYISRELVRLGHHVTVLCARLPDEPVEHEVEGISVRRCGPVRPYTQSGSKLARIAFVRASIEVGRGIDADLVDGQNYLAYLSALRISRARDIPRIATFHDMWLGHWISNMGVAAGLVGEVLERYVLRQRWDHVITNSEATRNKLATTSLRAPMQVVYNGIALEQFQRVTAPRYERPTICYVGRLVRYKRVDDLLRALVIVRERVPEVMLKIVGSGPDAEAIQSLVPALGLERNVEFLGFVEKHRDVLEVMARSHVSCLPSEVEGFGMVVIESMACGTPVVASALDPIREITHEGRGSLLFPVGNVAELAEQLTTLLTDSARHAAYVAEAKALAAEYDWKPLGARTEEVYRKVLA